MITSTYAPITGTRLLSVPAFVFEAAHAAVTKPWSGVVMLGGIRVDDNSTGVSAPRRRH